MNIYVLPELLEKLNDDDGLFNKTFLSEAHLPHFSITFKHGVRVSTSFPTLTDDNYLLVDFYSSTMVPRN